MFKFSSSISTNCKKVSSKNYRDYYANEIPERKDIDFYYVYYWVEGNKNYKSKSGEVLSSIYMGDKLEGELSFKNFSEVSSKNLWYTFTAGTYYNYKAYKNMSWNDTLDEFLTNIFLMF